MELGNSPWHDQPRRLPGGCRNTSKEGVHASTLHLQAIETADMTHQGTAARSQAEVRPCMQAQCAESSRFEATPRVSIGMPVYNGERWLDETLRSLRAQTLSDFELIISDNASTDATAAICARHAAQDGRIRYYRNARNIGANRNFMALIALARADYFKWASSHDLHDPRFLELCVAALDAEPGAVLAYPNALLFAESLEDAKPYQEQISVTQEGAAARFIHVICKLKMNNAMNGVFRTRVLRRAHSMGSFHSADVVMMAELALFGRFVRIPEHLFFRRVTKESFTPLRPRSEVDRHFEPDAGAPLRWQRWKFQVALLRDALVSAPLGREKVAATIFALKSIVWNRSGLMREVAVGMGLRR